MKNPFPQPPYVAYSNAGTLLVQRSGADITDEQKLFVLHAINQHEKLVAFCSRIASFGFSFDSRDQANGAYRDAVRWLVRDAAALLKEEKP